MNFEISKKAFVLRVLLQLLSDRQQMCSLKQQPSLGINAFISSESGISHACNIVDLAALSIARGN